jgi:hypothetical protein
MGLSHPSSKAHGSCRTSNSCVIPLTPSLVLAVLACRRVHVRGRRGRTLPDTASQQQLEQSLPMPPTNHSTQPDHCSAGAGSTHCCRRKFITRGFTPRRGRRGLPVTLGHHHKPSGSARTARGPRALDLVGALHALCVACRQSERRGARQKGVDQDGRTIELYATGTTSVFRVAREG